MFDLALEELREKPCWQRVLLAYRSRQSAGQDESNDQAWLPRLQPVEGVPCQYLPRIHGKLIALGLLQFQLVGRTDGVQYRVSPEGLRALEAIGVSGPDALSKSA